MSGTPWGLIGAVLLTCDQRDGEWLSLDEVSKALGVKPDTLRPVCDGLAQRGLLQYATREGAPLYGVHVQGVAP